MVLKWDAFSLPCAYISGVFQYRSQLLSKSFSLACVFKKEEIHVKGAEIFVPYDMYSIA